MSKCPKKDPSDQCCCECKSLIKDYYHCTTDPEKRKELNRCICSIQKGWICLCMGRAHSNWHEHSCGCELFTPKKRKKKTKPVDKKEIVLVHFDDWTQIYENGKATYGNHSINLNEITKMYPGIKCGDFSHRYPTEKWLEEHEGDSSPEFLKDIELEEQKNG